MMERLKFCFGVTSDIIMVPFMHNERERSAEEAENMKFLKDSHSQQAPINSLRN